MKTSAKELRRLIKEEAFLHGVPEWALRQDASNFVDAVRDRIKRYIMLQKSENSNDQREAIAAMNDVCDDLEDKVYALIEEELFNFVRRV